MELQAKISETEADVSNRAAAEKQIRSVVHASTQTLDDAAKSRDDGIEPGNEARQLADPVTGTENTARHHHRAPKAAVRRALDALYDGAAALAALFMVGLLAMVLLSIVGRQAGFHLPGTDAYAGYLMAGSGFIRSGCSTGCMPSWQWLSRRWS